MYNDLYNEKKMVEKSYQQKTPKLGARYLTDKTDGQYNKLLRKLRT